MPTSQPEIIDPRDALIRQPAEQIEQQAERIKQLEQDVAALKALIEAKADSKASKKPTFSENYSLGRNKKTNKKKPKKKSTGRKPSKGKDKLATKSVDIYPENLPPEHCQRRRTQYVWRLIDGKAIYVAYHLFAPVDAATAPLPPGVRNGRCEAEITDAYLGACSGDRIEHQSCRLPRLLSWHMHSGNFVISNVCGRRLS